MRFINETFANTQIELDFNHYERCTFERCQIIYRGLSPPDFIECRFEMCDYTFDGPAANLIAFLRNAFNSPGRHVADGVIAHIQGNQTEVPTVRGVTH